VGAVIGRAHVKLALEHLAHPSCVAEPVSRAICFKDLLVPSSAARLASSRIASIVLAGALADRSRVVAHERAPSHACLLGQLLGR